MLIMFAAIFSNEPHQDTHIKTGKLSGWGQPLAEHLCSNNAIAPWTSAALRALKATPKLNLLSSANSQRSHKEEKKNFAKLFNEINEKFPFSSKGLI